MSCESCGGNLNGPKLETLRHISTLPDALGTHSCECGYPEMRCLSDRTFHGSACGSEILPIYAESTVSRPDEHSEAYWAGWMDSRFGRSGSFVDNPSLAKWGTPSDRLDFYRGHRAGSEARQPRNVQNLYAGERLIG